MECFLLDKLMVHLDMKKLLHKVLIAGINASLKIKGKEPVILDRSHAYIGVLIDDIVTKRNIMNHIEWWHQGQNIGFY